MSPRPTSGNDDDVLVLGAGVIGLTTALCLQNAGWRVHLWAREQPLYTTSAVAAAVWTPFAAAPRDRVLRWAQRSYRVFSSLCTVPESTVCSVPGVELARESTDPPWWRHGAGPEVHLDGELAAQHGCAAAWRFEAPVAPMNTYLPWLVEELRAGGTEIETRDVTDLNDALRACRTVVQCTGLGARELCGDTDLTPARGQVVVVGAEDVNFDPALEGFIFDDANEERPLYIIPRGDEVVIGGTYEPGREDLGIDPAQTQQILDAAARYLSSAVDPSAIRQAKVGLRPCRSAIRLERQTVGRGRTLVHNYGHGGSGMTLSWGCADEVVERLGPGFGRVNAPRREWARSPR